MQANPSFDLLKELMWGWLLGLDLIPVFPSLGTSGTSWRLGSKTGAGLGRQRRKKRWKTGSLCRTERLAKPHTVSALAPSTPFPFFSYWCSPGRAAGVKTGLRPPAVPQNWPRIHPTASAEQVVRTPQPLSPLWKLPEPPAATRLKLPLASARHVQQRAAAIGAVRDGGDAPGTAEGALPQPLVPSGGEWTARRAAWSGRQDCEWR